METLTQTRIIKSDFAGTNVVCIKRENIKELFLTFFQQPLETLEDLFIRIASKIKDNDAQVIKLDVFGAKDLYPECWEAASSGFKDSHLPITYIDGSNCFKHKIAGVQIYAIAGVPVKSIKLKNSLVGHIFEDDSAKFCYLTNIHPDDTTKSQENQTLRVFEKIETGLLFVDMAMTDIVRTWFFNQNILEWYKEFNKVRSDIYRKKKIFDNFLPASTGIGGNNPYDAALVANVVAIKSHNHNVSVKEIPSPLQCPAYDYKSSFSRAAALTLAGYQQLYISGTASIDPNGKTAHVGNTAGQIELTFNVVEAILKSRKMKFSDITRAIAYFKHQKDAHLLESYCNKYGLSSSVVVIGNNDICRDELLFEIEVDAISTIL